MRKSKLVNCPQWLLDAETSNENVIWENDSLVWINGIWKNGTWENGIWEKGIWINGIWEKGIWRNGTWENGTWENGTWFSGTWKNGIWCHGIWEEGTWQGLENRMLYMAALCGIVFNDVTGYATAYRSVKSDYTGRYTFTFTQPLGVYWLSEGDYAPGGSGTCMSGIHCTSAARAWTYFGVDPTARCIEVKFTRDDLLDCDGEKARIRGGIFREVPWPFMERV